MGHTPYLLKPNLSTPFTTTKIVDTTAVGGISVANHTLTGTWTNVKPTNALGTFGDTRTDWVYITNGTYQGYCWRVIGWTTGTCTIDGNIPTDLMTSNTGGAPSYIVYSSVDARCAWTDPTTITYIPLATSQSTTEDFGTKLQITRYANAGHVTINLKNTESTKVFPLGYKGNLATNENAISGGTIAQATGSIASQMQRAINYAMLYWPSTSPKYSNIFWYNGSYRSSHRDVYDVATTAWRMERCYMLKLSKEEDIFNNIFLKALAVELV